MTWRQHSHSPKALTLSRRIERLRRQCRTRRRHDRISGSMSAIGTKRTCRHTQPMSALGVKRALLNHTMRQRLLVVGCLARAPSKECGRCLLTKLGLAQFTARLFWRFTGDWWLVFTIFDALSPHAVAARYTRPIRTHHNSTPLNISKAAGKMSKNRRLRRSAPNGPCRWGCRTDNAGAVLPRSDPASIHPRIAAWYKLG